MENNSHNLIKIKREEMNITIEELSKYTNISLAKLQAYEDGETEVSDEDKIVIAKYLNFSPKLLGLKNYKLKPFENLKFSKNKNNLLKETLKKLFNPKKLNKEEKTFLLENQLFHPENMGKDTPSYFLKIALALIVVYFLSYSIYSLTLTSLALSLLVPFCLLWFLYEYHHPLNIKGIEIIRMFVVGGITSILLVYWMRDYVGYPAVVFLEDILTGLVEETAKLLIVLIFVSTFKVRHMITGMLIGFAVGAGFDVFETADYGMAEYLLTNDFDSMQIIMAIRSAFSLIGLGHHFWTAILAGALVFFNQKPNIRFSSMFNLKFGIWFLIVVILHALNNFFASINIFLCLIIAVITLVLFTTSINKASNLYRESIEYLKDLDEAVIEADFIEEAKDS